MSAEHERASEDRRDGVVDMTPAEAREWHEWITQTGKFDIARVVPGIRAACAKEGEEHG
jgi:hypothetical protein